MSALAPGLAETPACPAGLRAVCDAQGVRLDLTIAAEEATTTATTQGPSIRRFHVVLPPHAALTPEVLDYRLEALPPAAAPTSASLRANGPGTIAPQAEAQYAGLREAVAAAVRAEEAGVARFWRIGCVTVRPAPVVPAGLGPYRLASLTLRFAANEPVEPDPVATQEATRTDWGIARLVRRIVANPDGLALYGRRDQGPGSAPQLAEAGGAAAPTVAAPDGKWVRLRVAQDGLVAVTRSHLEAAGVSPSSVDPRAIRVYSHGRPVPAMVLGPATNRFSSDTSLVFYGLASRSPYGVERSYWVRCDGGSGEEEPPARIVTQPTVALTREEAAHMAFAGPAEVLVEQDNDLQVEQGSFLSIKGSHWVWAQLNGAEPLAARFDLPYAQTAPATSTAILRLRFYCADFPPPSAQPRPGIGLDVTLNDRLTTAVQHLLADGDTSRTIAVPAGWLRERGNVLTVRPRIQATETYRDARVYFDNATVTYERPYASVDGRVNLRTDGDRAWYAVEGFQDEEPYVLDLTDPEAPERLPVRGVTVTGYVFREARPGRTILAIAPSAVAPAPDPVPAPDVPERPEELADPRAASNAADYVVIYHPMFSEQIAPLLELHAKRGLRVASVGVDRLFEAYTNGELDPHAIKDFLTDAVRHWAVPPTYAVLFGDATSDYRNELRTGVPNLVPGYTYMSTTGDRWASELWYAAVAGSDWLPDLAVGRLSVANEKDAAEVVRKAVDYTLEPPMGPWRNRFDCVSDNAEPGFEFEETAQTLCSDYVRPGREVESLYLRDFALEDNFYVPADVARETNSKVSTDATLALLAALNRGSALLAYVGHGSPNLWATERMWFGGDSKRSDNRNLRNGGRLPFVASFTCNQGAFDYPKPYLNINISEDMMRTPHGGAIAMYVPSGPGVPAIHAEMARDLMLAVERDGVYRLGEAVTLSRFYSLLAGSPAEVRGKPAEEEKFFVHRDEMVRMSILLGDPALDLVHPAAEATGTVKPSAVQLPASGALPTSPTLTFEARLGDLPEGRFAAVLQDPERRTVASCPATAYAGGAVRWTFTLPQSPAAGRWRVAAYCGNDAARRDAAAWAAFEVLAPPAAAPNAPANAAATSATLANLSIVAGSLRAAPEAPVEGHTVFLHARVANAGREASPRFRLRAFRYSPQGTRQPITVDAEGNFTVAQEPLAGGTTREVTLRWDAPTGEEYAGANVLEVQIDTGQSASAAPSNTAKVPVRVLSRPNARLALVPVPGLVTIESASVSEPDSQGLRKAAILVRALPALAAARQPGLRLGLLRRAPRADEPLDSPHCMVRTFSLSGQDKQTAWNQNWDARPTDGPTSPTAVTYREDVELTRGPSDDSGTTLTAKVRVRNYGDATAANWEVDLFRRAPVTKADLDDPELLIRVLPLDPLAGGESRVVTCSWRVDAPDDEDSRPTVLVLRNLETIRSETHGKPLPADEWPVAGAK